MCCWWTNTTCGGFSARHLLHCIGWSRHKWMNDDDDDDDDDVVVVVWNKSNKMENFLSICWESNRERRPRSQCCERDGVAFDITTTTTLVHTSDLYARFKRRVCCLKITNSVYAKTTQCTKHFSFVVSSLMFVGIIEKNKTLAFQFFFLFFFFFSKYCPVRLKISEMIIFVGTMSTNILIITLYICYLLVFLSFNLARKKSAQTFHCQSRSAKFLSYTAMINGKRM